MQRTVLPTRTRVPAAPVGEAAAPGGQVGAPLVLSSTYHAGGEVVYARTGNPTWSAFEEALGDLVFAEPKALIGFAGPRTIKATIRVELPPGFQTSEFLLQHGFIDRIVPRSRLKSEIARSIDYCGK